VQSGEVPHLIMAEPPRPRIEAIRIVDMSWPEATARASSNDSAAHSPLAQTPARRPDHSMS
jgi:hypothetical protein